MSEKVLYGTGLPDPKRGAMEALTESRADGELAESYQRTKRQAAKKAADTKIRANMSTEIFRLDPLSRALNQVVK